MATITGRYGAVEIARPSGVSDDATASAFQSIWSGSYANDVNGVQTLAPTAIIPENRDLVDEAHLFLPQGTNSFDSIAPSIVSSITSWSLENTINPIEYAASNTRGYKGKLAGLHDASGNMAGLGPIPPLAPGQRFRFYGFTGPSNGVIDNPEGIVYAITAIVNSVQIQISYQMNNPITWTVGWQADWHQPGDELCQFPAKDSLGFWDYTAIPCCSLLPSTDPNYMLEIWDETDTKKLTDLCLLDANIQFNNETAQYANSCSAQAGGWQSRLAGPTTCSVSTNIQGDDFTKTGALYPGTNHKVKLWVGDSKQYKGTTCKPSYWLFHKLFFSGFSGLSVDTTSNTPLQFSCNMDFNAYPDCTPGYIAFSETGNAEDEKYLVNLNPSASV